MTSTMQQDINPLKDLVNQVYTEIVTTLSDITSDDPAVQKYILDICGEQIEGIGIAAECTGLNGLNQAADCMRRYIENLNTVDLTPEFVSGLVTWLEGVITYISDPTDIDLFETLVTPLPLESRGSAMQSLQNDALSFAEVSCHSDHPDTADTESNIMDFPFPTDESMEEDLSLQTQDTLDLLKESSEMIDAEFDFDALADNPESIEPDSFLGMLSMELREMMPQFQGLAESIFSNKDPEVLVESISGYQELLGRVSMASEGIGLVGLEQVCQFVETNLMQIPEIETEKYHGMIDVFQNWPTAVIGYLENPQDDSCCLSLVDYLENERWPVPLAYGDVRGLLEGLTKDLELSGDFEVEDRVSIANSEDVALEIQDEASQDLIDAFFMESPSQAEQLAVLIGYIASGDQVQANTVAAQRISHTLKGSANLIGVRGIASLAHYLEDIFEYMAKQHLPPPAPLAHTMQEAADTIEVMLESLQGISEPPQDAQRILQDVLDWANRIDQGNFADECTEEKIQSMGYVDDDNAAQSDSTLLNGNVDTLQTNQFDSGKKEAIADVTDQAQVADSTDLHERNKAGQSAQAANLTAATDMLRVSRNTIDNIFNMVGETSIAIGQIQERLKRMRERSEEMRRNDGVLQTRRMELENIVSIRGMASRQRHQAADNLEANDFDSLEMDEYSEFYGATHSFIESVVDNREASRNITDELMMLEGLFLQQLRLNRGLQQMVMSTRMMPVDTIAARLQRAVRQASRATGKEANLIIIGQDMLMDGDVLNRLADPLMHMLRNAVDHSIEAPEDRISVGKPASGQIQLRFAQEGNAVVVSCADDGQGLDYDRIRWVGMERGLISEHENLDKPELARLILNSGFSTREQATQVSGRGVGMDVVHNAILNLKGSMEITDNDPCGTLIALRLPITLLTSHSVLVRLGVDRFAIPTTSLEQILSPGIGTFSTLGTDATYQLGREVYPAVSLAALLGQSSNNSIFDNDRSTVLLVRAGLKTVAVSVEYVISSYDLVVKSLGKYVQDVRGISGVALLGDGNVVPVLDVADLLYAESSFHQSRPISDTTDSVQAPRKPRVLIVDDSLSVRNTLSQLVGDAGYEPLLARDGIEAIAVIEKQKPDLVLTDLEMPRMNGLELASQIRSNQATSKLPLFMITSRTMQKHREQAISVGINEFVNKPFSEDNLMHSIASYLN